MCNATISYGSLVKFLWLLQDNKNEERPLALLFHVNKQVKCFRFSQSRGMSEYQSLYR